MSRAAVRCLTALLAVTPVVAAASDLTPAIRAASDRGNERFDAGDPAGALVAFQEAEAMLSRLPDRAADLAVIRYNRAECLESLGRLDEALALYDSSLQMPLPAALRPHVTKRRAALDRKLFGSLLVRCDAADVRLSVDALPDQHRGCGAEWPRVPVGHHTVTAQMPGRPDVTSIAEIRGGERATLELAVPTRPAPAPTPEAPPDRALAWVLSAAAGAAVASGAVFYAIAASDAAEGKDQEERYRDAETTSGADRAERRAVEAYDRAGTRQTVAFGLLGVGVALAGGALWNWLSEPAEPASGPDSAARRSAFEIFRATW